MSFRLAAQIAGLFDATVDAVHFSEVRRGDADIALQSMPFLKTDSDNRVAGRARESERAYRELVASLAGATFTGPDLDAGPGSSPWVVSRAFFCSAGRAPIRRMSRRRPSMPRSMNARGR